MDNVSSGHGLAFAIHCRKNGLVPGIIHTVPIDDLEDFLRMEGVLDGSGHVSSAPSYKIIEVHVSTDRGRIDAFSLEGKKSCKGKDRVRNAQSKAMELEEYIEASQEGAREQGIPTRPFAANMRWLQKNQVIST